MRGEQLLARMEAASTREVCPEIGLAVKQFEVERKKSYAELMERELKDQEVEMREKRKVGRRKLTHDPFLEARALKAAMTSAAYLEAAAAKNKAEDAMAKALAATRELEAAAPDESDDGLEVDESPPAAPKPSTAKAGTQTKPTKPAGKPRKRAKKA